MRYLDPGLDDVVLEGAPLAASFFAYPPALPQQAGLRGLYLQQIDTTIARRNYAGADATVVGAPSFPAEGVGIITDKADYLDTGFDITPDATYFGIAQRFFTDGAHKKSLLGNFTTASGVLAGDMVSAENAALAFYASRSANVASDNISLSMSSVPIGDWYFWAGAVTAGSPGQQRLYLGHAGSLTTATPETQANRPAGGVGRTLKLGSSDHPTSYTTAGTEFLTGIASVAYSDADIQAIYAYLVDWAARYYGIDI